MGLFSNVDIQDILGMGDTQNDPNARADQRQRAIAMLATPMAKPVHIGDYFSPLQGADYVLKQVLGNANLNMSNRTENQNYMKNAFGLDAPSNSPTLINSPIAGGEDDSGPVKSAETNPILNAIKGGMATSDIAPSGLHVPASIRNNNPGAMWPGKTASQFGAVGAQDLRDGNKIAKFANPVDGASAMFGLLKSKYVGMTLKDAIRTWSGNNSSEEYTQAVSKALGIDPETTLSSELLSNPKVAIPLAKVMAKQEAGKEFPLADDQWQLAFGKANGSPTSVAGNTVDPRSAMPAPMGVGLGRLPPQAQAPVVSQEQAPTAPVQPPPTDISAPGITTAPTSAPAMKIPNQQGRAGIDPAMLNIQPQGGQAEAPPVPPSQGALEPTAANSGAPVLPPQTTEPDTLSQEGGQDQMIGGDRGVFSDTTLPPKMPPLTKDQIIALHNLTPEHRQELLANRAARYEPTWHDTGLGKIWQTPDGKVGFVSEPKIGETSIGDMKLGTFTRLNPITGEPETKLMLPEGELASLSRAKSFVRSEKAKDILSEEQTKSGNDIQYKGMQEVISHGDAAEKMKPFLNAYDELAKLPEAANVHSGIYASSIHNAQKAIIDLGFDKMLPPGMRTKLLHGDAVVIGEVMNKIATQIGGGQAREYSQRATQYDLKIFLGVSTSLENSPDGRAALSSMYRGMANRDIYLKDLAIKNARNPDNYYEKAKDYIDKHPIELIYKDKKVTFNMDGSAEGSELGKNNVTKFAPIVGSTGPTQPNTPNNSNGIFSLEKGWTNPDGSPLKPKSVAPGTIPSNVTVPTGQ